MTPVTRPLPPGLAGYLQAVQQGQQQGMGNLQMAQTAIGLQNAIRQQERERELEELVAQSDGKVEVALAAALKSGNFQAAAKLAPIVEAQRKATAPKILTPGSQVLGPNNEVLHTVPVAERQTKPELLVLQEHLANLPQGDPRRFPVERRISQLTERNSAGGAAPSGYRFKADGSLEPIPGGPHSPKETGFTPDAIELRARQYLAGDAKAFANLGRGAQGKEVIAAISNRAAEILRAQGGTPEEIGRRIAEFRANSNSLSKMTQSYDALTAFEQTAVRNGRILVDLAEKVDATGVPVAEKWIRAGRKATGDPDVARFDAQMQVYRTEAARILTNPNLSGQLTDNARKEVEEFLRGGSSAGQIKGVVTLLERDFKNRKETLEQQMRDIRTRLEKNTSAGEPASAPTPAANPGWAPEKEQRYQELLRKRGS